MLASRAALRGVLNALGGIAVTAGAHALLTGVGGVLQGGAGPDRSSPVPVSPNVDSEMRFFAPWYIGAGGVALSAARSPEEHTTTIRALFGLLLLSALGRALSIAKVGRPHRFFMALMGIELALPAVMIPWQHAVAQQAGRR